MEAYWLGRRARDGRKLGRRARVGWGQAREGGLFRSERDRRKEGQGHRSQDFLLVIKRWS